MPKPAAAPVFPVPFPPPPTALEPPLAHPQEPAYEQIVSLEAPAPDAFAPPPVSQPAAATRNNRLPLVVILLLGAVVIAGGVSCYRSWISGKGVFGFLGAGAKADSSRVTTGTLTASGVPKTPIPTSSVSTVANTSSTQPAQSPKSYSVTVSSLTAKPLKDAEGETGQRVRHQAHAAPPCVQLDWQATVTGTAVFVLERRKDPDDDDVTSFTVTQDQRSYLDRSVFPGTTYTYSIRGESDGEKTPVLATESVVMFPRTPQSLIVSSAEENRVALSWDTKYQKQVRVFLYRSTEASDGLFDLLVPDGLPGDQSSYTDAGLKPGKTYWYKIEARNEAGASAESAVVQTKTPPPLATPAPTPVPTPRPTATPRPTTTPAPTVAPETETGPSQNAGYTPAPGSPERTQMMEALRTPVQQYYSRQVKFKVLQMRQNQDLVGMVVQCVEPDSSGTDPAPFSDIPKLIATLRMTGGQWRLVSWKPVAEDNSKSDSPENLNPSQTPTRSSKIFRLGKKSDGVLLSSSYPKSDLLIELNLNYSQPGAVLDTIGINAAPVGSFSLVILPDGHVQFQVYDPNTKSVGAVGNGWHFLRSKTKIPAGTVQSVRVYVGEKMCTLSINGKMEAELPLAIKLSGNPLYVGDFPGDEAWGNKYNIHQAMTGTVTVDFLGNSIR
ncbi:MAG: hypothetical protein WCK47_04360 [bacterium]